MTAVQPEATTIEVVRHSAPPLGWDAFVKGAPGAAFCHLAGWADILGGALSHETTWLVASDAAGDWQGVLPLTRVRSRLFGDFLVSVPFLNYGGPIGNEGAREKLAASAVELARDWGVDLLEMRGRVPATTNLARSGRKITVLLELPSTADELFRGFSSKLRSQVRRPEREGMTAEFGIEQVLPFYEIFARNMRDLGTPVLPLRFFEQIASVFPDTAEFAVVYHEGRAVAGACGFHFDGEFEITWASSLREWNHLAPNMLLYWKVMEQCIARGTRVFNFGRCSPGSGTHRFKRQWGGRDVPLPWEQWSRTGLVATPSPDRPKYRMATACWRRLPLPVANYLGPMLARRLP